MIDHVGNIGAIKHLTFCNAVVDFNWLSCLYAVYIFKVIYILDCSFIYVEIALLAREVIPCLIKKAIFYPMDLANFWTRAPPDPPKYMHIKNLQNK